MATSWLNLALLALTWAYQVSGDLYFTTYPVDLTIALLVNEASGQCDISRAPTMHIYSVRNISAYIVDGNVWANSTEAARSNGNGTVDALANYTISNAQYYSANTSYRGIYYQQLSGNTTRDQARNAVGTLKLATYPCPGAHTLCDGVASSGDGDSWLQWSCDAPGACYPTGYPIRSWALSDSVDQFTNITAAESNGMCQLGTIHYANATRNNNTMQGSGHSLSAGGSLVGVWSAAVMVFGMFLFM